MYVFSWDYKTKMLYSIHLVVLGIISNPYPYKQHPAYLWFAGVNKTSALPLHQYFNRQFQSRKNQGLTNINQTNSKG